MALDWKRHRLGRWSWCFYCSGIGLALIPGLTGIASAQENPDQPITSNQPTISVPPPPPMVPVPATPPGTTAFPPDATSPPGETVFQAPTNPQPSASRRYLVYVNGDSPYLLQQVQAVAPQAFVQQYQGKPVIQVGTFNDEANARRQVEALQEQGIMATLATNSLSASPWSSPPGGGGQPGLGQAGASRTSPYLVVIPGNKGSLSSLAQQTTRLGVRQDAIQMRDVPLGPHLAIGPFANYNEAREVSNYLRKSGMDARVFYNQ